MNPRTRQRLQIAALAASLVVLAAAAASMLDTARLVEVVALAGSAFAAGATTVKLVADRRRDRRVPGG
jgi:4-hydroxybenzoate polyprenyltransferase